MKEFLNIHSILSIGSLDGYGNRTVIFLQGCPFRCAYCHNPDTWSSGENQIMTVEDVALRALRYKNYWGQKGGVTVSGGEPLLQAQSVLNLIRFLQNQGVNVAVDTSGGIKNVDTDKVLLAADHIILDIKHTDCDSYHSLTCGSLSTVLDNLSFLRENGKHFWIRQVIVTGINDTPEQVKKLKELSKGAARIELKPFHKMGAEKWERLKIDFPLKDTKTPSDETMERLNNIL